MNKKLIFRILGALSSTLMAVSVFIPFVSVTGYSQSLWSTHEAVGTLYIPIMIIIFGLIGIIFFSINIKTELAYSSAGAVLFFLIVQTIPIIEQGTFGTLSVGYYCLVIGTLMTGIMAFLCNLRTKKRVIEQSIQQTSQEVSVLNKIDKLYDNQNNLENISQNNISDNVIEPLPPQINLDPISEQIPVNPQIPIQNIENNIVEVQDNNKMNDIVFENQINEINDQSINPVVSEFKIEQPVNQQSSQIPVVNSNLIVPEFEVEQPVNQQLSQIPGVNLNPTVSEFEVDQSINQITQPIQEDSVVQSNPVVEQFNNSSFVPGESILREPVLPAQSQNAVEQSNNNNNLDIFG